MTSGDGDRDHADEQRDARGDQDARQDVAPKKVGAERMGHRRRRAETLRRQRVVHRVGVVRGQVTAMPTRRGEDRLGAPTIRKTMMMPRPTSGQPVALEAAPGVGPQAERRWR